MRDAEVRDIRGRAYEVTPLPAGQGFKLMLRIGKALGPIASFVGNPDEMRDMIGEVIAEVLKNASEEDLAAIYKPLAECTIVHTTGPKGETLKPKLSDCFDVIFAADYLSLFLWLGFALEVNFGPLIEGLKTLKGVASPGGVAGAAKA